MEIKAKNINCHFEIFFEILSKANYDESIRTNELFESSVKDVLAINLRLKDENKMFYNKNNELILMEEYYQDIYTLDELKNNCKGFEFLTELNDFKKAFIDAIKADKFELLIIKNMLLLKVSILNYFNEIKNINVIVRPYINKIWPHQLWYSYNKENNNVNIIIKEEVKNVNNFSYSLIENKFYVNKKRLRNRETPSKSCTNSNSNNKSYSFVNNKKNKIQSEIINIPTKIKKNELPEFECDSLSRESDIINLHEEEMLI